MLTAWVFLWVMPWTVKFLRNNIVCKVESTPLWSRTSSLPASLLPSSSPGRQFLLNYQFGKVFSYPGEESTSWWWRDRQRIGVCPLCSAWSFLAAHYFQLRRAVPVLSTCQDKLALCFFFRNIGMQPFLRGSNCTSHELSVNISKMQISCLAAEINILTSSFIQFSSMTIVCAAHVLTSCTV